MGFGRRDFNDMCLKSASFLQPPTSFICFNIVSFPLCLPPAPSQADWLQLLLMSCCAHHVIANSSFSWWAAYLHRAFARRDPEAVAFTVAYPAHYHPSTNPLSQERGWRKGQMYPSDWTEVAFDADRGWLLDKFERTNVFKLLCYFFCVNGPCISLVILIRPLPLRMSIPPFACRDVRLYCGRRRRAAGAG